MNILKVNSSNIQRGFIIIITISHFVFITVMSSDNNRVFGFFKINVCKIYVFNKALSTSPSLDSNTILTVDAGTVVNIDLRNKISSTAHTKRTNTVSMTSSAGYIRNSHFCYIYKKGEQSELDASRRDTVDIFNLLSFTARQSSPIVRSESLNITPDE